ncbi:MAG: VOC family protein [Ferruginibacter sp.]
MGNINSYLTFGGNCRQAMQFYKSCLGGELIFQTVGASSIADEMPLKMKKFILHSTLTNDNMILMATDMVSANGLKKGNAVSLMLNCNNEQELKLFYKKLSRGGQQTHPPEDTFWGAVFGGLTDKFGIHWLLNCNKQATQINHQKSIN